MLMVLFHCLIVLHLDSVGGCIYTKGITLKRSLPRFMRFRHFLWDLATSLAYYSSISFILINKWSYGGNSTTYIKTEHVVRLHRHLLWVITPSGTIIVILVGAHKRNILVKLFWKRATGRGGDVVWSFSSTSSSDGHFVQLSEAILAILVEGYKRNISVKLFWNRATGQRDVL